MKENENELGVLRGSIAGHTPLTLNGSRDDFTSLPLVKPTWLQTIMAKVIVPYPSE